MPREAISIKMRLEYLSLRYLHSIVSALPWRTARGAAMILGDVIRLLDRPSRKANTARNLRQALPELTDRQVRRVIRDVYRHLVESVVEAAHFLRFVNRGHARELLEVQGEEKLKGRGRGLGVIFVTGHLGCWEVLGAAASQVGYPVWSVARPFDNPLLEAYVRKLRRSTGQSILPHKRSMASIMRLLRQGRNVAFLIDQDARRHGIFVDFFGRPASTITSPARMAIYTGAPVAFIHCTRIERTNRFKVILSDVVWPRPGAERHEETFRITRRITKDLEQVIRSAPAQWLWLHRRWRTYPGKYD